MAITHRYAQLAIASFREILRGKSRASNNFRDLIDSKESFLPLTTFQILGNFFPRPLDNIFNIHI